MAIKMITLRRLLQKTLPLTLSFVASIAIHATNDAPSSPPKKSTGNEIDFSVNEAIPHKRLDTPYFFTRYTAKDADESERCQVKNRNQAFLKWEKIDGASAYETKILKGHPYADDWLDPSKTFIDTIVSSNINIITIPYLDYTTTFSFSIRAISPFGEEYDSDWWGQEGFTEYKKILSMQMDSRYSAPSLTTCKSNLTDTSIKLRHDYINPMTPVQWRRNNPAPHTQSSTSMNATVKVDTCQYAHTAPI